MMGIIILTLCEWLDKRWWNVHKTGKWKYIGELKWKDKGPRSEGSAGELSHSLRIGCGGSASGLFQGCERQTTSFPILSHPGID